MTTTPPTDNDATDEEFYAEIGATFLRGKLTETYPPYPPIADLQRR